MPVQHHRLMYVRKKNDSFHKLFHLIQIFIKIFVVHYYPRNISNTELFLNYDKYLTAKCEDTISQVLGFCVITFTQIYKLQQ